MISPLEGGGGRGRRGLRRWVTVAVALALAALAVALLDGLGPWQPDSGRRASSTGPGPRAPRPGGSDAAAAPPRPAPGAVSLAHADAFRLRLRDAPRAGLVFDVDSGRVLWRLNPDRRLPIASLTKMMTALLVVERTRSSDRVKLPRHLVYSGSGVGILPLGHKVPIEGLMAGLLVVSGNDAAIALADDVGGNVRAFVRMMNAKARELQLRCTRFVSPHGLEPGNRSCAVDLAALARLDIAQKRIARLVHEPQVIVPFPVRKKHLYLNSTNPLLRDRYKGTIGLKTGSTDKAGHCFVGIVRRGRRTLGVVLLNSPNPLEQAKRLLDRAFRTRPGG